MTLKQVKALLHIGLENPAVSEQAIIVAPGPKYLEMVKRIQEQASVEHADPRAVKALMVLSGPVLKMGTFFSRSLTKNNPLMLYEHSFN